MSRMARKAQIIGVAHEIAGRQWDVRERRPTRHGFDVEIGWPSNEERGRGGRGVAAIATPALAAYLAATRLHDVDLPLGGTTIKRLRKYLDIVWSWDAWWAERSDDLHAMTLEAFCSRHGCSVGAASQRRAKAAR